MGFRFFLTWLGCVAYALAVFFWHVIYNLTKFKIEKKGVLGFWGLQSGAEAAGGLLAEVSRARRPARQRGVRH